MRILALGDIVGKKTAECLQARLWGIRKQENIDFVIANGENVSDIRGICAADAETLLGAGVDLITLGNHTFGKRDIYPILERGEGIIRPANYPPHTPGDGYAIVTVDGWKVLCINICGRVYMDAFADPFATVERILAREAGGYDFAVMDIHAEATSEKLALAHCFDGRIAVMFGTHTHVPTADAQILPKGSGYVTDLGMCGPKNGILGTATEDVLEKFRTMMPTVFHVADGEIGIQGVIFEVDGNKTKSVRRIEL